LAHPGRGPPEKDRGRGQKDSAQKRRESDQEKIACTVSVPKRKVFQKRKRKETNRELGRGEKKEGRNSKAR